MAGGGVRQEALASVDAASGGVGSGQDLPALLGALRDAFSTLQAAPANATQQRQVVEAAAAVARAVNTIGAAVDAARQGAHDGAIEDVARANGALRDLGALSDEVAAARARGLSTADLEDKRDAAIQTVTELTGAQVLRQPDGGLLAVSGGTVLSLHAASGPLSAGFGDACGGHPAGGGGAGAAGGGQAAGLTGSGGGRIGAQIELRDGVLPGIQAQLDAFAQALAGGFAGAGLELFTDASGLVPPGPGFAQAIRVAPAVVADPAQVRDGAGGPGALGSTVLIDAVLAGPLALGAGAGGAGTLANQASLLVAANAGLAAGAARQVATDQAVQTSLATKLSAQTGVSVDSELAEMVKLQNSYGANARVISAVQAMWTDLLASVR